MLSTKGNNRLGFPRYLRQVYTVISQCFNYVIKNGPPVTVRTQERMKHVSDIFIKKSGIIFSA